MAWFRASFACHDIFEITGAALKRRGIRLLLADLDNTLVPYGVPLPDDRLRAWRDELAAHGVTLFLLSNNRHESRPRVFAEGLDVPYIGIDTRKDGEAMARQLAEALGHKGEAGIVSGGLEQQSHRQRMEGFAAYMENELGKKLFVRGNYNVRLTDEGMLLRKRAEDILDMVDKTQDEFKAMGGDVRIGCAESDGIKHLARRIKAIQKQYPAIRFHLYSGDTDDLSERLDRGLFDFAVIAQTVDLSKYNYLEFPEADTWGVIMRKDSPLAQKEKIRINDLLDLPLIVSRQGLREDIPKLFGEKADRLSVKATINLTYNGSILTREGVGYVLTFEKLVDISEQSELCFRPLTPALETKLYFIWKKYQVFTSAEELLLTEMREQMNIAAV